jgi:hypothetical protein
MSSPFDPKALELAVQRTLHESPDVPDDAKGAFLVVANQDGIKAVTAIKIDDRWRVEGVVSHGWHEGDTLEYGVSVRGTF